MEDLKNITSQNNVLQLSKALQKIAKTIVQQKTDSTKADSSIAELNFLKQQCLSNNVQLSLLSSQTLYGLIETGTLKPADVLTMYITMLSNANTSAKISVIGEGIINILLLDLKIATLQLKSNASYKCPFGMKISQHPIITLMHNNKVDILELANKLNGILNHSDEHIKCSSIEFLRPVFLHALCNPIQIANVQSIWTTLLKHQKVNSVKVEMLLHEVFAWCRITPERCLSLTIQLIDVIELFLDTNNIDLALEYQIYLTSLLSPLIEFGYDPRNALNTIQRTIQLSIGQSIHDAIFDYTLITISQVVPNISPFYLKNVLEIIKVLTQQTRVGNVIIRNMILDGLIIQLAINGKILQPSVTADIERLIKHLLKLNTGKKINTSKSSKSKILETVKYYHPTIVMNCNLLGLSADVCAELSGAQTNTLERLINFVNINSQFADEMHFFLRSILLSIENLVSHDMWSAILKHLLKSASANSNISCNTIYFILYLLAKETDGRKQIELLRGLTAFGSVKENIPLILNAYRSLSSSTSVVLRALTVDLHTRLWLVENRTYQFLYKVLIADDDKLSGPNKWEMNVVKANAIKEICSHKASQHGVDLVSPLSKILSSAIGNDLASSLALDAIVWLCKSHTVNIVSTWKILCGVFESKLQRRTTKSLCEFFGEVPLLKTPSTEYDSLFRKALDRLWNFIMNAEDMEITKSALQAMRNFDFPELTLEHVPPILYQSIKLPKEYQIKIAASHSDPNSAPLTPADVVPFIPGECWIQLLKHINQNAVDDAIEFVVALIESEMLQYKSGVYMLPEGRPEPHRLQHLHARSPLLAMVRFLIEESDDKIDPSTAQKCLQCISSKFSRPIPPLNWFFLIEYINEGAKFEECNASDQFELKKYALKLASNQIGHSGSAKSLIENYLQSLDASTKEPEEIQMALELTASVCNGVSANILATFIHNTLTYVYELSASSHFEDKCHFEIALYAIVKAFDCLMPETGLVQENIDVLTDEISRFNKILPSNSKIYDKYSTLVIKLPSESLDRLSTPTEWNGESFKKSLAIRIKAVSSKKQFPASSNAWMWMNLLIDNVINCEDSTAIDEGKELLLAKLSNLLINRCDEMDLCEWIMDFLGIVQSNFRQESTNSNIARSEFSLEVFIYCIVTFTGCATFVDDEINLKNRTRYLNKFPEALWQLSKRSNWTYHMPRIFEFLYHLYHHIKTPPSHLPKEYSSIIYNTLICVKSHEYFLQKSTWPKFIL